MLNKILKIKQFRNIQPLKCTAKLFISNKLLVISGAWNVSHKQCISYQKY